jgi:hypothetical protein
MDRACLGLKEKHTLTYESLLYLPEDVGDIDISLVCDGTVGGVL